jgi:hypothetical protein
MVVHSALCPATTKSYVVAWWDTFRIQSLVTLDEFPRMDWCSMFKSLKIRTVPSFLLLLLRYAVRY